MSITTTPSSKENTVQSKQIALTGDISRAYPVAVQAEVARQLSGFDELPKFSQEVARRVLSRLPESISDNKWEVPAVIAWGSDARLFPTDAGNDDYFSLEAQG